MYIDVCKDSARENHRRYRIVLDHRNRHVAASGLHDFANGLSDVMGRSKECAHLQSSSGLVHPTDSSIQGARIAMSPRKRRRDSSDDVQPAKKGKTSWERPPKIEDEPGEPYWEVSYRISCTIVSYARISLDLALTFP